MLGAGSEQEWIGQAAPELTLQDQHGKPVTLADFRGKSAVVLYFYPKDNTPVCTVESCSFRDQYEDFREAGAEVIGISADSEASHQRFAERHGLPFILLADPDGVGRKAFKVSKVMGLWPGRVTFLIDREGIVRQAFSSQLNGQKHVSEMLKALGEL